MRRRFVSMMSRSTTSAGVSTSASASPMAAGGETSSSIGTSPPACASHGEPAAPAARTWPPTRPSLRAQRSVVGILVSLAAVWRG